MRLEAGIKLPDFSVTDLDGETVSPGALAGRRSWLILTRFAACPFCSLRLHEIIERQHLLDGLPVETVVFFPSKEKRVRRFMEKYDAKFRAVADERQQVFQTFGSETSWAGELRTAINIPKVLRALARTKMNPLAIDDVPHRMPSDYLVEPDGTIARVHYGEELDDGIEVPDVVRWVRGESQPA